MPMKCIQEKLTAIWNDDHLSEFSNPFCSFLYTLSLFYGAGVRLRNSLYDSRLFEAKRLPCPVVSVGNITVGGTGKTPMVILIANMLLRKGRRPVVLSRGYAAKGKRSLTVVSDGKRILAGPDESGDEPFLIAVSAGGVPVLTGRNRHTAGMHAIEKLGADTLVLDDAFQHRQVFRNVNILLLDAERPFGNGCLLPRGTMREPGGALRRADIIVLTRADEHASSGLKQKIERIRPDVPVFIAWHRPVGIVPLSTLQSRMPFPSSDSLSPDSDSSFPSSDSLSPDSDSSFPSSDSLSPDSDSSFPPSDSLSPDSDSSFPSSDSLSPDSYSSFPPSSLSFPRRRESTTKKTSIPDPVRNDNSLSRDGKLYNLDSLKDRRVFAFAGIARPDSFRKSIESLGGKVAEFRTYPDHHPYTVKDVEDIIRASREMSADIILTTEKDGVKIYGLGYPVPDISVLRIEMEILSEKESFEEKIMSGLGK